MNKDIDSFEWFVALLGQIELQQVKSKFEERFIDMHLYITSAKKEQELKTDDANFSLKLKPGRPDLRTVINYNFMFDTDKTIYF